MQWQQRQSKGLPKLTSPGWYVYTDVASDGKTGRISALPQYERTDRRHYVKKCETRWLEAGAE